MTDSVIKSINIMKLEVARISMGICQFNRVKAVTTFLESNKLLSVIRAHEA